MVVLRRTCRLRGAFLAKSRLSKVRTGNEAALELLEDIAIAAPTSAMGEPPDEGRLSVGRDAKGPSGEGR